MTDIFPPIDVPRAMALDILHMARAAIISEALRGHAVADIAAQYAAEPDLEILGAEEIEATIWAWLVRTQLTPLAEQDARLTASDIVPVSAGDTSWRDAPVPVRRLLAAVQIGWDETPVWVVQWVANAWLSVYTEEATRIVDRQRRRVARAHLVAVRP
jgi:hypothetical protein